MNYFECARMTKLKRNPNMNFTYKDSKNVNLVKIFYILRETYTQNKI